MGYVKLAFAAFFVAAFLWFVIWIYRRGKQAAREELRHEFEEKLARHDKKIFRRLMHPRPDDFGRVRHPDADWQNPSSET